MPQTFAGVRTPWVTTLVVLILLDSLGWSLGILPGLHYALTHLSMRIVRVRQLYPGPADASRVVLPDDR